ncbi:unnamed protein product [Closterium sp. Naga37s-1]|nr:unnamed protein product [Closterium sp. Naga37s-1]
MRDAAITNGRVSTHLHALISTILGGNLPGPVADLLTASRLIAPAKPGGGARPIAIGKCITRLTAKAALAAMGDAARDYFLPLQYGVAVPGGAEAVIHVARAYLDKLPNSLPHEQEHEELEGWERIEAPGELAANAAEVGAAVKGLVAAAADTAEPGVAPLVETDVAAAAEMMDTPQVATKAAGMAGEVSATGTAAASDGDLISSSAVRPTASTPPVDGGPAVVEPQTVRGDAESPAPLFGESPSPLGAAEIEAVVAETGRQWEGPLNVETAPTAAESAGVRRPPLSPRAGARPEQHSSSPAAARTPATVVQAATAGTSADPGERPSPVTPGPAELAEAGRGVTGVTGTQGTRRSARLGTITWGPPRGGRTPWMPAGRGATNGAAGVAGGAGAERGGRGDARGGFRGGRGGRNALPRNEIPLRADTWRERHSRPERAVPPANEEAGEPDDEEADPGFMGGEEETSEEISLENEDETGRNNHAGERRVTNGEAAENPVEGAEEAVEETDVPSPFELAEDDSIWQIAGGWNVDTLRRGDQPFLVRRLPPQLLDRYCLCMLATLLRLQKYPTCQGGWTILQFLPRLTLRPEPEPVTGSRWAVI